MTAFARVAPRRVLVEQRGSRYVVQVSCPCGKVRLKVKDTSDETVAWVLRVHALTYGQCWHSIGPTAYTVPR